MRVVLCVLASMICRLGWGAVATGFQTHPVLYRDGAAEQPLIGIRLALDWGGSLRNVGFRFSADTPTEHLSDCRLWVTSVPWFIPPGATDITAYFNVTPGEERLLTFYHKTLTGGSGTVAPVIPKADRYLWLTAKVNPGMPADARVDVSIAVTPWIDGQTFTLENPDPAGETKIFPYKYRVAPYYRASHLQPNRVRDTLGSGTEVFSNITDIYLCGGFGVACDTAKRTAWLTVSGQVSGAYTRLKAKRAQMQQEKPGHHVNIILCIMTHTGGPMATIVQHADLRSALAENLVAYVTEHGYDGIDIDYEFPYNPSVSNGSTENGNYAWFMAELKRKLFAAGKTLSIATAVSWGAVDGRVCASCDWVNTMTYDGGANNNSGGSGDHSTFAFMQEGVSRLRNFGLADCRIVAGLPFYSNETTPYVNGSRNWDAQRGWSNFANGPWNGDFDSDTAYLGNQKHYFNGPTLIRAKADWIRRQKLGGSMIWAYDTDLSDWNHAFCMGRILSRANYPEWYRGAPPRDADGYALIRCEEDLLWFAEEVTRGNSVNAALAADIVLFRDFPMIAGTYSGHFKGETAEDGSPRFTITIPEEGAICGIDGAAIFQTLTGRISGIGLHINGRIRAARFKVDGAACNAGGFALNANAGSMIENCRVVLGERGEVAANHESGLLASGVWVASGMAPVAITRNEIVVSGTIRNTHTGTGRIGGAVGQANQADVETKITFSGNTVTAMPTARFLSEAGTHTAACALLGNRNGTQIVLEENSLVVYPGAVFSAAASGSSGWPHQGGFFSTAWSGSNAVAALDNLFLHRQDDAPEALGANAVAAFPENLTFPVGVRGADLSLTFQPTRPGILTDYPENRFLLTDRQAQKGSLETIRYRRSGSEAKPFAITYRLNPQMAGSRVMFR